MGEKRRERYDGYLGGADAVLAGAGEAVGEDDLEPGLVARHAALAVGEVAAVAEPEPGRRHGGSSLGAAHPWRGRLRLHGPRQPPRQRAQHGRRRRGGHRRRAAALGRGLLVPHLRHRRRHPHGDGGCALCREEKQEEATVACGCRRALDWPDVSRAGIYS